MKRTKIKALLATTDFGNEVTVMGWVKTFRNNQFIAINDGSSIHNIQAVVDFNNTEESLLKRLTTGASVAVTGTLVESLGKGQHVEIKVKTLEILGDSDAEKFPLQPKKHSLEFLREIAHLRFRTNTFNAVFKVRHALAFAVHQFFNERGFVYLHTPIITASDAEGAGEMFRVSVLDPKSPPLNDSGRVDFQQDFFAAESRLTVSGQLQAEVYAQALGSVYTFGPTFRAENSNTRRHVAEFWMLEPEMAFCDLGGNMDHGEELVKYLVGHAMEFCEEDLSLFFQFVDKSLPKLMETLLKQEFARLSYTEAIEVLKKSNKAFEFPVEYGIDLQSEHERYLTETHFKKPVIVFDYPKTIKPFYMRLNDDNETVAAMDLLVPGSGELIGGSQREERLDFLLNRMEEMNVPKEDLWWYLETRKFGTCPHAGFGLGFERLVGVKNSWTRI